MSHSGRNSLSRFDFIILSEMQTFEIWSRNVRLRYLTWSCRPSHIFCSMVLRLHALTVISSTSHIIHHILLLRFLLWQAISFSEQVWPFEETGQHRCCYYSNIRRSPILDSPGLKMNWARARLTRRDARSPGKTPQEAALQHIPLRATRDRQLSPQEVSRRVGTHEDRQAAAECFERNPQPEGAWHAERYPRPALCNGSIGRDHMSPGMCHSRQSKHPPVGCHSVLFHVKDLTTASRRRR
jgi:hypothetical protein